MKRALLILALGISMHASSEGLRIANWPDTAVVTGSVAVTNLPSVQNTTTAPAASATMSVTVAISTSPVQVVSANAHRRGLFLYNPSTTSVYIAYDSTISYATHASFVIPAASSWAMPSPIYQGVVTCVRAVTGDGKILITEMQ